MDGVGLFDGFAGFLNFDEEHSAEALRKGLVVPDTNVLLNLYKYNEATRQDMLRALSSAGNRLFIPHQVLVEFWRNRRRVLNEHRDSILKIHDSLLKVPERVQQELDRYRRITRDENDALEAGLSQLAADTKNLAAVVEAALSEVVDPAAPTADDPVLKALGELARGCVQPRPDDDDWAALTAEGLRRAQDQIPPGYLDADKDKDEYAAGDFLVWEAATTEAIRRKVPLVVVTGDVKEDWWSRSRGDLMGARPELVDEFQARGGRSVVLMQPTTFLRVARDYLRVEVAPKSIEDAEDVASKSLDDTDELREPWTPEQVCELLRRLDEEGAWQAEVLRKAATRGGSLSRKAIYRIAGRDPLSKLTGWSRPISRITRQLQEEGLTGGEAYELFTMTWEAGNMQSVHVSSVVVDAVSAEQAEGETQ